MKWQVRILVFTLSIGLASGLGCASSDGRESSDSGVIEIQITPETVVAGKLAFFRIDFSAVNFDDIDTDGLTLKIVLPVELEYITDSGALVLSDGAVEIDPTFVGAIPDDRSRSLEAVLPAEFAAIEGLSFLVFSLPPGVLGEDKSGSIQFDARALDARVEAPLFLDLDRTALSSFNPLAPAFDIELRKTVEIGAASEES